MAGITTEIPLRIFPRISLVILSLEIFWRDSCKASPGMLPMIYLGITSWIPLKMSPRIRPLDNLSSIPSEMFEETTFGISITAETLPRNISRYSITPTKLRIIQKCIFGSDFDHDSSCEKTFPE